MPIHQTKSVMAKPQAFGIWMPQMPTPTSSRYATATRNTNTKTWLNPKTPSQPRPVGRVSTRALIFSVTEPRSWPAGT